MPKGKERLRHPFVTAAWATGGVLTCLLGVFLAVWSYEAVRDAVETARRERAAQHWPEALSLCGGLVESQARREFGFGSLTADEAREAASKSTDTLLEIARLGYPASRLASVRRHVSLQRSMIASGTALTRWDNLSGEGFQLHDVEVPDDSGLVRFSGAGTGFAVVSGGIEYLSGTRLETFAVREQAYGFAFTYDPKESRCLELLLVLNGK